MESDNGTERVSFCRGATGRPHGQQSDPPNKRGAENTPFSFPLSENLSGKPEFPTFPPPPLWKSANGCGKPCGNCVKLGKNGRVGFCTRLWKTRANRMQENKSPFSSIFRFFRTRKQKSGKSRCHNAPVVWHAALLTVRGAFHMPPPGHKATLPILSSDSIAAFLCRKEAQRKAIKRNAEKERGLFGKSPL